ncbi:hypothetical protein FRB90_009638 [Tulasnella sp. 427]|nr:hypothetical protein FRB90_009638 [Tulasnella sp. 427]
MPPKSRNANSTGFVFCDHCSKTVSRITFWRHKRDAQYNEALAANLSNPLQPTADIGPSAEEELEAGNISITSTEQALSDLSDVDDEDAVTHGNQHTTAHPSPGRQASELVHELTYLYNQMQIQPAGVEDGSTHPGHDEVLNEPQTTRSDEEDVESGGSDLGAGNIAGGVEGAAEWDLEWDGLPGLVDDDQSDAGGEDLEAQSVDAANDHNVSDSDNEDSENSSQPESSASLNLSSPKSGPAPELRLLWDLQAARNRAHKGIPEDSSAWTSVKAFKLQMETNLGANGYQKFRNTFETLELPALSTLRQEMAYLCGLEPQLFDCCKNSCMCFVGPYASLQACTYCSQNRFQPDGQPFNQFHYVPIIPQCVSLYSGKISANAMRYRSQHEFDNLLDLDNSGSITDIYDSILYRELRESNITVNGHELPRRYLDSPRDVLLTGLTDGFQLFRRGKHTAWPFLFVNNNLSPASRYQSGNVLCAGLIPGPNKPKDHDSFTYVVVQELTKAAFGVQAYDALDDKMFDLRVFCPWKCGDMPATTSAYTGGKHHGAKHPCRFCYIQGTRIPGSSNINHYIPITRPGHPPSNITSSTLKLRSHQDWMQQAKQVDEAPTQAERQRLSQAHGINHTAIASKIPGFRFPWSVPFDLMHLLENTIKNYIDHICGDFKDMGSGSESYILAPSVWKEIGHATFASNKTVPSTFEDRSYMTAEAHLVWATMYSRILLRNRFTHQRYYTHWCRLISIIERCIDFKSTAESRAQLRSDIEVWYDEYEKIFYQYKSERLPACVLTIHAWLHVPDIIEHSGPMWAYWCWVMERFCGRLSRAVSSRKWPYASLNRRILEIGTLHSIRHMYALEDRLPPYTAMYKSKNTPSYHDTEHYPEVILRYPRTILYLDSPEHSALRRRIIRHLITQYDITANVAAACIPPDVEQYGRLQIKDADTVNSALGYSLKEENTRDATFIQYELRVDQHAHQRNREPVFRQMTFFGQLERIILCWLKPSAEFQVKNDMLVLLDVNLCDAVQDRFGFWEYENFRYREIIDGKSIRALVGRIRDRGKWVFVQRSGAMEHAEYTD